MDINDGYLSDVPTHRSGSPSEVSQDLVASTKVLEQHFKEKYSVLRHAYEDRIKRMSDIINATCKTILSDEIIQEMKQDRVSSVFVLSHANEIIDRHLESDREVYINELLEKISQQDLLLRKKNKEVLGMREAAARKEKEQSEKSSSTSQTISKLQNQLRQKIDECEKLRVLSEQREEDIHLLEQSFQQSAKELALIEGMDKKEQIVRSEMKEQLRVVSRERQYLQDENYDLRTKLQNAAEEIDRLQLEREQYVKDEEANRQRISQLMEQVEKTLEQEANESNLAISTVHDKMKNFRNRLVQELQKERKLNSLLQEELQTIKSVKEDSIKDHRRLQEEDASLRAKLIQEQEKSTSVEQRLHSVTEQISTYKLQMSEWEGRCRQLEDRLTEQARSFQQELKVREEAARLEAKKAAEQEQRLLEQKTVAFRLHYENEVNKLSLSQQQHSTSQLRASQSDIGLAIEDFHLNEVIARMRYDRDEMIDKQHRVQEEHQRTMEEHRRTMETMRNEMLNRHQNELRMELRRQELEFKAKYEQKLADAQALLVQAGQNIEKLKVMVKEGRAVMTLQNQRIEHLKKEYDTLQNTVFMSPSTKRSHAHNGQGHRVAFGSTVVTSAPSSRHTTPSRKENQSFQANTSTSVMDVSTVSTLPSSTNNHNHANNSILSSTSSSKNMATMRTPQDDRRDSNHNMSTTVIASAETPLIMQSVSNMQAPTPGAATSSSSNHLQHTVQFLQSQVDTDRQRILQLEATIAQLQGETDFYQQQHQQLQQQYHDAQQLVETLQSQVQYFQQQQDRYMTTATNSIASRVTTVVDQQSVGVLPQSESQTSVVVQQQQMDTNMSNTYVEGGYDRGHAMAIIEEAQTEARVAKLRCLELEHVISELRSQLDKAEKASAYLQAQRQDKVPLTQQYGLLPKDEEKLSNQASMNPSSKPSDESVGGFTQEDDAFTIPSINGLVELQEKLEQSNAISKHWEEKYQHQGELLTVKQQELQEERLKIQDLRKRERELFILLTKVHQKYRTQIHQLRVDLDQIRSLAVSFAPFAANERLTSMNQIRYIFKSIFDVAVKKQEKDMKDLRIAMQSAHNADISILEAKFIEQVNALNQRHTKELEKMHEELLARTERAMNASMTASAGVGLLVAPSSTTINESTMSNVSILSSMDDISSMLHPMAANSNGSARSSDSRTVKKIGELSLGTGAPAWESVLKGVLQGLRDQDAITYETSSKVQVLSEAHQEPSFAANAAARALIGDDIDRFVVGILQKKYGGSPSTKDAAAQLGAEY